MEGLFNDGAFESNLNVEGTERFRCPNGCDVKKVVVEVQAVTEIIVDFDQYDPDVEASEYVTGESFEDCDYISFTGSVRCRHCNAELEDLEIILG